MGCFSFYANKVITTGEGGMVTTNDDALAERLRLLRNLAFTQPRFRDEVAGFNFRMTGYQCRDLLSTIHPLRWLVVEQTGFVECGRREFAGDVLRFFDTVEEAAASSRPNVVLLSGVLQYVTEPIDVLESVGHTGADYVVIDRTPIAVNGEQTITVQVVPETLNSSSYPIWLFKESTLKGPPRENYEEIGEFDALDGELGAGRLRGRFRGFIFQRKTGKGGDT